MKRLSTWLAETGWGMWIGGALFGVGLTLTILSAPSAHADPAGNAICRLLAAGNTPDTLESSVTVRQVLGPDATAADARVYIRSVVAGQCPQFLWRW